MARRATRQTKSSRWQDFRALPWWRKVLVLLGWGVVAGLAGLLALLVAFGVAYAVMKLPNPNTDFKTNNTTVLYRDGVEKLGTLSVQNRESIPYADMPQLAKDAVVAAENRTFWEDPGFDIIGMGRAVKSVFTKTDLQGGSTITQQYIKILYLNSDISVVRKFKEIVLAVKIGNEMSKTEILEGYLNTIYFGRGAYGIEAAAKAWFDVPASQLTLEQTAVLASVINNPSGLDPKAGKNALTRLTDRYKYVLNAMAETGKISASQRDQAAKQLPDFPRVSVDQKYAGPNGFLIKAVENELKTVLAPLGFKEANINGGGLTITTTFSQPGQEAMNQTGLQMTEEIAQKRKQDPDKLHLAMASVDAASGEVLAMFGGPDFIKNSRNWAMTDRPAASTFKPYALVAALRTEPMGTFSLNTPLNGNTFTPPGEPKPVRNAGGGQYGTVSLEKAVTKSINTAFVDLVTKLPGGPKDVIKAANDLGVNEGPGWDPNYRIALGSAEVSPLEQASAYTTFANGGSRVSAHFVREVKDQKGQVIFSADTAKKQVLDPIVASEANKALQTVTDDGTGAAVRSTGFTSGGKTGTGFMFDRTVSSWFVGYTKQIATAVMFVAGDDGTANLDDFAQPGNGTFLSSNYPTRAWINYMKVAMKGLPNLPFDEVAPPEPSDAPQPEEKAEEPPPPVPTVVATVPKPTATPKPTAGNKPPKPTPDVVPTATKPVPKPTPSP